MTDEYVGAADAVATIALLPKDEGETARITITLPKLSVVADERRPCETRRLTFE